MTIKRNNKRYTPEFKQRKDMNIMDTTMLDVIEEDILELGKPVLDNLLKDRTTRKNIIWATNDYITLGQSYDAKSSITIEQITGNRSDVIQPRVSKARVHQSNRTRDKAEVFTPSWICNEQNNLIDEQWFGRKDVFNIANNKSWISTTGNICFDEYLKKTWKTYVDAKRLEISCGEAPYLVSRYDTVSGETIPINERIGLLDRKLRIVNENTSTEKEWIKWATRAVQSIYGFEYQGDNLLLARENILYTFIDNMKYKLGRKPTIDELKSISLIISWNIWQMDGISFTVPFGAIEEQHKQLTLFDIFNEEESVQLELQICKIKDWRSKVSVTYKSLVEGKTNE